MKCFVLITPIIVINSIYCPCCIETNRRRAAWKAKQYCGRLAEMINPSGDAVNPLSTVRLRITTGIAAEGTRGEKEPGQVASVPRSLITVTICESERTVLVCLLSQSGPFMSPSLKSSLFLSLSSALVLSTQCSSRPVREPLRRHVHQQREKER